jgi:hypothetical protein
MSKKIFISHAAKDKKLADALVDLLQTGINISADDIFCSSLEGLGIPQGTDFIAHIKAQIQQPKVVVALLTQSYLASQFCMCELGATWAMSHRLLPLLVSPMTYHDFKGVLTVTQLASIDSDLTGTMQALIEELEMRPPNFERWEAKKAAFLKKLSAFVKTQDPPSTVSASEHDAVKEQLNEARKALEESEIEISDLKETIEEISSLKDQAAVRQVKLKKSSAAQRLNDLENAVREQLAKVNRAVACVAYRSFSSGGSTMFNRFQDQDLAEDALQAESKMHLYDEGNGQFQLGKNHPVIKKLVKALTELSTFLQSADAPPELLEEFESEHDFPLAIENWDYWGYALDKRLGRMSPP